MLPATQAFVDTLKAAGWKVGLYTGHHTYKPLRLDKVKADFLWIPRYGRNDGKPNNKPDFACDLWQYTEKGKVSWYNSFLDLNMLTGSKSLEWFLGHEGKPPAPVPSKPMWKGLLFKKGQIGLITILKPINLWIDVAGKLTEARTLKVGDQCRVYGYREKYGGQYDVGGGHWVIKMDDYIQYETPSKALLEKAKEFYK